MDKLNQCKRDAEGQIKLQKYNCNVYCINLKFMNCPLAFGIEWPRQPALAPSNILNCCPWVLFRVKYEIFSFCQPVFIRFHLPRMVGLMMAFV